MQILAPYFVNHSRSSKFPWVLYHRPIDRRIDAVVSSLPRGAEVLTVGCGLFPIPPGCRPDIRVSACDLDPRAIETCRRNYPEMESRLSVSPGAYELPPGFVGFDCVIAKEVIEHVGDPGRFFGTLAGALAPGGTLLVSTPNYGFPLTLPLLEHTVLEGVARLDGYSRRGIHPSPQSARSMRQLRSAGVELLSVERLALGWALLGQWCKHGQRG